MKTLYGAIAVMFAALGASSAGVALAEETCDAFSVGVASSMQRVRPNGDEYGPFPRRGVSAQGVSLRLAINEWESVQICVKPTGGDLHKVRVVVDGDLTREGEGVFASSNITCSVVGYVNVTNKPPYRYGFTTKSDNPAGYYRATAPHRGGWWPDPILDFLGEADVKKGVSQSFWVRVHCPHDQSAGTYRGALIVSAENMLLPVETVVERVNRLLKGWGAFYSVGYPSRVFRKVNHYVLKRMARFLNRKSQRYYRLKFADTYYGEMTHYGLYRLAWADVRRARD